MNERNNAVANAPWINILWQSSLAALVIAVVITAFSYTSTSRIDWAIGVGCITSSAYILFASPHSRAGSAFDFVGCYVVALLMGLLVHLLLTHTLFYVDHKAFTLENFMLGFVLLFYILITTGFKIYHPPAAGLVVVLSVENFNYHTVLIITVTAVTLSILRVLLRDKLKNLMS